MEWNLAFKLMSAEEVFRYLSSFQEYLYLEIKVVMSGVIPEKLKSLTNGPISHSGWLQLELNLCIKKNKLTGKAKKNIFIVTN